MRRTSAPAVLAAACILASILVPAEASGQAKAAVKVEPFKAEEFPSWALDLRRADIIAFGSLPFTVFFAQFAIDSWRYSQHINDRRYAPWPLKPAGAIEMDESQRKAAFAAGCAGAVAVALVDYIIMTVRRNSAARSEREKPKSELSMTRSPWPPLEDAAPPAETTPPADVPPLKTTPPADIPPGEPSPSVVAPAAGSE